MQHGKGERASANDFVDELKLGCFVHRLDSVINQRPTEQRLELPGGTKHGKLAGLGLDLYRLDDSFRLNVMNAKPKSPIIPDFIPILNDDGAGFDHGRTDDFVRHADVAQEAQRNSI
jgi:hypothetical protein